MREQLNSELKKSIINKDLVATKTIRLIIAAIKDRDIVVRTEGNQNGINEADIISLLKMVIQVMLLGHSLAMYHKRLKILLNTEEFFYYQNLCS